ncbi:MAG TPA: ABC transporter ATP-binding protein [Thermoanaerobaculia bacterium]|jgi:ABC-type polysaccharide/polyol phosphate transport system ATPase subunit|nr:ABC transporter ATP-binding protein [Thermoanaerobaculia bacterium]
MTAGPAVLLEGVSLCYRLAKQRPRSLKEYALHWIRGQLVYEKLWALRDVDLSIAPGESVGVVGRNGAGKSTLLRVISGVLKATRGRVLTRGRMAPILELGTGFDPELTGLENIRLFALFLGRTHREIDAAMAEIVEFSGLGDFVRSPVRSFSAGMLARLGFAVVAAWTPDLLIVDEALAVGDAAFLARCRGRLAEFRRAGTTILLVSHQPELIRGSCGRCLRIEAGRIAADGEPEAVLARYAEERRSSVDAGT